MKRLIFMSSVLAVLAFALTSCNNDGAPAKPNVGTDIGAGGDTSTTTTDTTAIDTSAAGKTLADTKWELVGFFDVEKNELKTLESQMTRH